MNSWPLCCTLLCSSQGCCWALYSQVSNATNAPKIRLCRFSDAACILFSSELLSHMDLVDQQTRHIAAISPHRRTGSKLHLCLERQDSIGKSLHVLERFEKCPEAKTHDQFTSIYKTSNLVVILLQGNVWHQSSPLFQASYISSLRFTYATATYKRLLNEQIIK